MEVILRQDVDSLGLRGEVVNVARGYARNFLLPRGLAEVATPGLVRELEKRDRQRARHEAKSGDEAKSIATRLESLELRFDFTAGPPGALFGSVPATNVADRLWESEKIRIDRRKLSMDAIKRVGRYTVPVEVFADVVAGLKLVVAPEGQELPPQETLDELAAEEAAEQEAAEAAQAAAQQSSAREARAAEEEAAEPAEATPEPVEATPETADADPAFEPEVAAATEPAGSPAPGDDRATEPF
ncbi:MAG: large subunit ribosomal protein [Thermoleophilaceae bacterium]|nr:large subunit ribosomal protein [Thermoleophilaceae bacterium]